MCSTDFDEPDFYRIIEPIARKSHICSECRSKINVGERYRNNFCVFDGSSHTYRSCKYCMILQDWLQKECAGYLLGGLYEEIHEHAFEYKKMFLYRWLVAFGWKKYKPREFKVIE